MRRTRVILRLICILHFWSGDLSAQFSVDWIYTVDYGNGVMKECVVDNSGGVILGSQSFDTVCNYGIGNLIHINSNGGEAWKEDIYYESPCIQQTLQSLHLLGDRIYFSVQDTAGWVIKSDTSGVEIWQRDTGFTFIAAEVDKLEQVSAFVPQWSEVYYLDSTSSVIWNYSLPYAFLNQIHHISSDKNLNKVIGFEYQDPSQTESYGVGIIKLDSGGQFLWDTLLNAQSTEDEDLFVDMKLDNMNNIYLLSTDINFYGVQLSRIDVTGNSILRTAFNLPPYFRPSQMELDTIHSLIYIAGRTPDSLLVLKYDFLLNPLDTMYFDRQVPDVNVISINEYGYLFHMWMSDSSSVFALQLEMYNHLGQMIDRYTYSDVGLFYLYYPHAIRFDVLGNVFISCNGLGPTFNDVALVIKLSNPLNIAELSGYYNPIVTYPNPTTGFFKISIPEGHSNTVCKLYSEDGKLVSYGIFDGPLFLFSTLSVTSGFYLVETTLDNGETFTNKIIVQNP